MTLPFLPSAICAQGNPWSMSDWIISEISAKESLSIPLCSTLPFIRTGYGIKIFTAPSSPFLVERIEATCKRFFPLRAIFEKSILYERPALNALVSTFSWFTKSAKLWTVFPTWT